MVETGRAASTDRTSPSLQYRSVEAEFYQEKCQHHNIRFVTVESKYKLSRVKWSWSLPQRDDKQTNPCLRRV
jgi:hypothetical protein